MNLGQLLPDFDSTQIAAGPSGSTAVLEAAVIGMPHEIYGEEVVACVALKDGKTAGDEELRAFTRARLADYKVPERIVFLRELPKGITGKIHRREIRDRILNSLFPDPQPPTSHPRSQTQSNAP